MENELAAGGQWSWNQWGPMELEPHPQEPEASEAKVKAGSASPIYPQVMKCHSSLSGTCATILGQSGSSG